jgi:hypothetical protein
VFGETFVLLLMNSTASGAHTCVRPPIGIWMEALLLSSIVKVPETTQPELSSVNVTVYSATELAYTWLTVWGGTKEAPAYSGLPSPQSMVKFPTAFGVAMSKEKLFPVQLNQVGVDEGTP